MSKIAFLFPGQGSQSVGMGVALAESNPTVAALYAQASQILGWDLLKTCKEGPEDKLKQTDVAQPALFVNGIAAAHVLQAVGVQPDAAAGHSIGEYAALVTANVFSFAEGLGLVKERARLMREVGQARPGSMMAILGLEPEQVKAVCQEASAKGICVAVNFNSPEQTVIAGEAAGLAEAGRIAGERGAKRVIPLNVAGAFHSPLMADAAQGMKAVLAKVAFKPASIPVVMNADGQLYQKPEDLRAKLELQLDHPVLWVTSVQTLKAQGVQHFVECGAGKVLAGLLRRIDRELSAYTTETAETIKAAGDALTAARRS